MRSLNIMFVLSILFFASFSTLFASPASRHALGDPSMVLEEESTKLSLLNYGNPAGLIFFPVKSRTDVSLASSYALSCEKFVTGNSIVAHLTPSGLTLPANTLFARNGYFTKGSLNNFNKYYLNGYIFRTGQKLVLQIQPFAAYDRLAFDEDMTPFRTLAGGLGANSAYQLSENMAIGAGVSYRQGKNDGWSSTTIATLLNASLINQITDHKQLFAQFGLLNRIYAFLDEKDCLELGLLIKGEKYTNQGDYFFDHSSFTSLTEDPKANVINISIPWSITLQSIYQYNDVMDIGLEICYEEAKDQYEWSSDYFNDQQPFGYVTHNNIFYELAFRVRLPMVREDDLRFGVAFNNKGMGNKHPTGQLWMDLPDTIANVPEITTSSSSIAIETAVVPVNDSIFALKYHLGSSNSYQSGSTIDDFGFSDFTFSSQYKFWEHLLLRLSYTNLRLASELYPSNLIFTKETGTLRFGVGYTSQNFDIDLSSAIYRTQYKPVTNTTLSDVYERGIEGMLSFIYRY